ncbi:hypothetical protein [Streptomyces sp. NPDC058954]|uniref:hypothetical protein n=1 Tax=Streptomyces sp. NPDC058954 TaxID=3346677 RepID=UPI0036CE7EA2
MPRRMYNSTPSRVCWIAEARRHQVPDRAETHLLVGPPAHQPLPPTLIEALLGYTSLVVDGADRTDLFAVPLPPPCPGHPTDRLLALFGRHTEPAPRDPDRTNHAP